MGRPLLSLIQDLAVGRINKAIGNVQFGVQREQQRQTIGVTRIDIPFPATIHPAMFTLLQRGINQAAKQPTIMIALIRRLNHQHRKKIFNRVDPEGGAGNTAPEIKTD